MCKILTVTLHKLLGNSNGAQTAIGKEETRTSYKKKLFYTSHEKAQRERMESICI
jgi:hypothetical protein